jgi:hypothetical protein
MSIRSILTNPFTVEAARKFRNVFLGRDWNAFHRDRVYQALILEVLTALPVTSFVETGTWRGDSTQMVAMRYPALRIFTSEVVEKSFNLSRAALRKYPNITQDLGSSDQFIQKLIAGQRLGELSLFFLDAHWHTYWPLRAELKHISDAKLKCVIVIDDFEVPGQPQFAYDIDGGGELTEGEKCNLDYIRPSLSSDNSYRVLFPRYRLGDAYPKKEGAELRGHVALFQNLDAEFEAFAPRPLIQQHYFVASL